MGKTPTTSVRRLISLLRRSRGLVDQSAARRWRSCRPRRASRVRSGLPRPRRETKPSSSPGCAPAVSFCGPAGAPGSSGCGTAGAPWPGICRSRRYECGGARTARSSGRRRCRRGGTPSALVEPLWRTPRTPPRCGSGPLPSSPTPSARCRACRAMTRLRGVWPRVTQQVPWQRSQDGSTRRAGAAVAGVDEPVEGGAAPGPGPRRPPRGAAPDAGGGPGRGDHPARRTEWAGFDGGVVVRAYQCP